MQTGIQTQSTGCKTHCAISTRSEYLMGSVYPGQSRRILCPHNSDPRGKKKWKSIYATVMILQKHHSDNARPLSIKKMSRVLLFLISFKGERAGLWTPIGRNVLKTKICEYSFICGFPSFRSSSCSNPKGKCTLCSHKVHKRLRWWTGHDLFMMFTVTHCG